MRVLPMKLDTNLSRMKMLEEAVEYAKILSTG